MHSFKLIVSVILVCSIKDIASEVTLSEHIRKCSKILLGVERWQSSDIVKSLLCRWWEDYFVHFQLITTMCEQWSQLATISDCRQNCNSLSSEEYSYWSLYIYICILIYNHNHRMLTCFISILNSIDWVHIRKKILMRVFDETPLF